MEFDSWMDTFWRNSLMGFPCTVNVKRVFFLGNNVDKERMSTWLGVLPVFWTYRSPIT